LNIQFNSAVRGLVVSAASEGIQYFIMSSQGHRQSHTL